MARTCRAILITAFAILSAGALKAANFFDATAGDTVSGIYLGNASGGGGFSVGTGHRNWAIFALSGGVTITDPTLDGSYDVYGNVGIAGAGILTMSASRIQGDIFRDSGGQTLSGGANYTGYTSTTGNGAYLNAGVTQAINASSVAAGLSATIGPSNISLNNSPLSISNTGSLTVLNLQDLILSGVGAVLTLNGSSSDNYVINVSRYMMLSSSASIRLDGGLTAANVLFNVKSTNPYDVTLSGGSEVNGIILAPNRNVKLTGESVVNGEVIAKGVSLSGRSKVINPFISP
jgi:hypothetical protein